MIYGTFYSSCSSNIFHQIACYGIYEVEVQMIRHFFKDCIDSVPV